MRQNGDCDEGSASNVAPPIPWEHIPEWLRITQRHLIKEANGINEAREDVILSDQVVAEMKGLDEEGVSERAIAEAYAVDVPVVRNALHGEEYRHITAVETAENEL